MDNAKGDSISMLSGFTEIWWNEYTIVVEVISMYLSEWYPLMDVTDVMDRNKKGIYRKYWNIQTRKKLRK